MSKKNKPEQGSAKPGRIAKKAANITVDMVSTTVSTVLKAVGTVLLILLVTGMMFACVFAYYVKTCLTPNLDLSLEDFKLNESSTIWYQDSVGEWRELATLSGKENRIWVDYDQIPWYMVDKASIKGGTVDEFKGYLADKTKLKWTRPVSLLTFGIKDIIKRDDSFQGPRLG